MRSRTEVATPIGLLCFVFDDEALGVDAAGNTCRGAVTWSRFGKRGPVPGDAVHVPAVDATGDLANIVRAVQRWGAGDANALDPVSVLQPGSSFRQQVWQALRRVPGGDVVSYAELAAMAGHPQAVRAVGTTMALNSVAPFVPCHRVVRSDGSVGHYAYGSSKKERLLELEGVLFE